MGRDGLDYQGKRDDQVAITKQGITLTAIAIALLTIITYIFA